MIIARNCIKIGLDSVNIANTSTYSKTTVSRNSWCLKYSKKSSLIARLISGSKMEDDYVPSAPSAGGKENGVENKSKGNKKRLSVERIYQKKSQLEHILLRPDTYIGSVQPVTEKMWVYDEV